MLNSKGAALLALWCATLPGCQSGQLYVASNTVVGLHAGVNTARTAGTLQIGYDRYFTTVVPRSVVPPNGESGTGLPAGTTAREAMAVMSCSELEVDGIFVSRFVENLATGRAALNYAKALRDSDPAIAREAAQFFTCPATPQ